MFFLADIPQKVDNIHQANVVLELFLTRLPPRRLSSNL